MNYTDKLRGHIWPTAESHELAERLLKISGRNYPECESATFTLETDTVTLGDIARGLGIATTPPDTMMPYYRIVFRFSERILVEVKGPNKVAQVKWEDA